MGGPQLAAYYLERWLTYQRYYPQQLPKPWTLQWLRAVYQAHDIPFDMVHFDLYQAVAAIFFRTSYAEVTFHQRRYVKTVCYAQIYSQQGTL